MPVIRETTFAMSSGVTASCISVSADFASALTASLGSFLSSSGITEYLSSEALAKFPMLIYQYLFCVIMSIITHHRVDAALALILRSLISLLCSLRLQSRLVPSPTAR